MYFCLAVGDARARRSKSWYGRTVHVEAREATDTPEFPTSWLAGTQPRSLAQLPCLLVRVHGAHCRVTATQQLASRASSSTMPKIPARLLLYSRERRPKASGQIFFLRRNDFYLLHFSLLLKRSHPRVPARNNCPLPYQIQREICFNGTILIFSREKME